MQKKTALVEPSGASGEPKAKPELEKILQELQAALPGSPLELVQACGVGYATYDKWPHLAKGRPVR